MRVLVTGGAGFIGSHLVEALVARGDTVVVLDDLSTGRRENLAAVADAVELHVGSVVDLDAVTAAAKGCALIFHEAAIASVPRSIAEPRLASAVNLRGTLHVLEAARAVGARRVVFAGSAAVYGPREGAVHEDDLPDPQSPYAVDKLASEHYLRVYAALYGLETVTLRYFNVFGPRQDPSSPYSGVISIFADRLRLGSPTTIFGDGEQTRDFIYVGDVVRANLAAAEVAAPAGLVCNLGRGEETTLRAVHDQLAAALGVKATPQFGPARAGDIRHSRADVTRAASLLGFTAQTPIADGLAALIAHLRARQDSTR